MEDIGKLVLLYTASGNVLEEGFERAIWQYTFKVLKIYISVKECYGASGIKSAEMPCNINIMCTVLSQGRSQLFLKLLF